MNDNKDKRAVGNPNWQKGMKTPYSGGRPVGAKAKKTRALNAIYAVMNKCQNLERFYKKLQEEFDKDPIKYYERFVRPHEPKEFNLELDATDTTTLITGNTELEELTYQELLTIKHAQKLLREKSDDDLETRLKDAKSGNVE